MTTLRLRGHIDDQHKLVAQAPSSVPPGPVEVELILPDAAAGEVDATAWAEGVAREWAEDLADVRQDIYTPDDGEPVA
jgi:hypothetical protein